MWSVEVEPEVEEWLSGLSVKDFAMLLPHVERLAERGNQLRMPASRSLGDGLFELRFDLGRTAADHVLHRGGPTDRLVDGVSQATPKRARRSP